MINSKKLFATLIVCSLTVASNSTAGVLDNSTVTYPNPMRDIVVLSENKKAPKGTYIQAGTSTPDKLEKKQRTKEIAKKAADLAKLEKKRKAEAARKKANLPKLDEQLSSGEEAKSE